MSISSSLLLSISIGMLESSFCRFRGVFAVSLKEEGFGGVADEVEGVESAGVFLKKFEIDGLKPMGQSIACNQSE